MKLIIEEKEIPLFIATGFLQKLKGLMFQKNIQYALRFRCNGIHTFFMKEAIDVVLTDKDNQVLFIYQNLKPNKILLPEKNVYYTYELPKGSIANKDLKQIKINNK